MIENVGVHSVWTLLSGLAEERSLGGVVVTHDPVILERAAQLVDGQLCWSVR